ncbi:MAG: class Ib ribonucleoside-diphosphate reductase assembly flavoprotein NrdI [Muricomes sp.]
MLKVVYDSKTGFGKKFAEKVSDNTQPITAPIDSPCILVTRNVGLGMIPQSTKDFLSRNGKYVVGVVVNGSRKFGRLFCAAGPKIEAEFKIPILRNIERDGDDKDVSEVKEFLTQYDKRA